MDKKYQIFISSTFADLVEERQAVSRAILDLGHIPAGMEMFPAADVEQLTYIKKVIDECDYYVLIMGARYGSLDESGVSYTEREFDYALENGKTVMVFVHRNPDLISQGKTDKDDSKRKRLEAFIKKASSGRLVQYWENAMELRANAIVSLTKTFSDAPQIGWVRADQIASQSALSDVVKYRDENDRLTAEIKLLKSYTSPTFTDVADLENTVMKFSFSYIANNISYSSSRDLTIKTFFINVAPALFNPSTVEGVRKEFERALKERHGVKGYSISAKQSDVQDALMHLVATRHINMYATKTIDQTRNVTGYQLTPLGVKTWQENSYIRTGQAEN